MPGRELRAASLLVRQVRPVPLGRPGLAELVDLRIRDGVVSEVAPVLPDQGEPILQGEGRWVIPGLWDGHVHQSIWAANRARLDLSGATGPAEVVRIVAEQVAGLAQDGSAVQGYGFRSALWDRPGTVAELDAVSGSHPVALISGDCHSGWLNTTALRLLGAPAAEEVLSENDWFALFPRLGELPGTPEEIELIRAAGREAASRGVVGVIDMEFGAGYQDWPERVRRGATELAVRVATYADHLEDVIAVGLRSGDALPGTGGLVTMGPLKIIADGSLNTRTAYCHRPYADAETLADPRGRLNLTPAELGRLVTRATAKGLEVAVHAIGDAALATAITACGEAGAAGSIEHAQLIDPDDLPRLRASGLRASVQPAHLLDDRDVTQHCWPDRAQYAFALRSLLTAGVPLVFGSDAPVAPLDPWLAMAAAVHRSADAREPWNPAEALSSAEALAASTDGASTVTVGIRGDLALLDADPLPNLADSADAAAVLRGMRVGATVLGGRITYQG